jgi:hypothetical protein
MKKFSVIALVVAAAVLFAVPAMALDVDFSGHYRVRGYYTENASLNDLTSTSDARIDTRFRLQTVFKVSDNLKVTTRFDAHDNEEFESDGSEDATLETFNFERAWLTASFDMFDLNVGRMAGGFCGLKFCDAERDAARIKVTLKDIDPWFLTVLWEKRDEQDYNGTTTFSGQDASEDYDNWAALGGWKNEGMEIGMLYVIYDDDRDTTLNRFYHLFDPWFKGTFGPVTVEAEAQWFVGEWADVDTAVTGTPGTQDRDIDALRYLIDVGVDLGVATVGAGYAHADGQPRQNTGSEDLEALPAGWMGGNDWEPLLILTHSTVGANLGGLGNLNGGNASTNLQNCGMDMYYLYGSFAPMENLTLDAILGFAEADELGEFERVGGYTNVDDSFGWEFDIGATWQIMDNLSYKIKFAYLDADDFYKLGGSTDNVDSTYAVFNAIQVTF